MAVIGGGAAGIVAGPAAAIVPGSNGTIVMSKCESGSDCKVSHIWKIDPASGAERQVTADPSSWDDDPAVSPDGSRVAFQRCTTGGACRIAAVGIAGGRVTYLTAGTEYEDHPAFSPDGSKLVFSRRDPTGGSHLIAMNAAGGSEHRLTSGTATDREPAWSPDGSTIVFDRLDHGSDRIFKLPASGGSPVPLTAGPDDSAPSFSPDGSRIVFAANRAVQIMRSAGGKQHALTTPAADLHDGQPAFAPDGTQIVFERYSSATDTSPLVVMNANGSNQHIISGPSEYLFGADWQRTAPAPATTLSATQAANGDPGVTLGAPRRESIRKGRLYLFATSDEPANCVARGKVAIRALGKRYRLRPTAKALAANTRTRIRVSIAREPLRAIRAALARNRRAKARIAVAVRDGAGNVTTKALKIRLKK